MLFVSVSFVSNAATITSVKTGNWNDTTTWDSGTVPVSGEDVVIANNYVVTIASTQTIASLTINGAGTSNYGKLIITTGALLTTTGSTIVDGKLDINGGTFDEGNGSGDKLTINGTSLGRACLFSMSGGTLNTSRYFALSNSSSFEMTGGTININSKGGTSATDIFYLPSGTSFTMSSGTINILNGNKGTGAALKFNPTTSSVTGGTINFTNVKNYATITLISSNTLYDINSDVGAGYTLVIQNMPSSTGGFACHNFSITTGTVQVDPGFGITVSNALTNNLSAANLVVVSDATGNGSLIVNGTVSGSVTVERYVGKYTSGTGTGNGWHEIGCPVASMDPNGTNWDPNGTNNDLYAWSESDNKWVNYRTTPFTFSAGNGYLMANNTNLTHEFTGILNTGDVAVSGLTYTSGKGNGWHLLGNPFSSAIRWNDGNWTLTNVGTTAEIYDEESGNYFALRYNTTDYRDTIPSTDGFFVQVANGTTGSVTIPSASRFHCGTKNNYKSEKKEELKETLIFEVTNDANSYYDVNMMGFKPEATKDWDIAFDAHKLFGNAKAPQLWTVSKDQKFQVNYLPEVTTVYDIPLDFRAGVNTVYHLTIKGADSFENTSLVLEDLQTGEKIDLSNENSYDFSAAKDDDVNRFVLHINGVTGVPTLNETDGIQIFAYGKTVCLHTSGQKSLEGKVSVFNMRGQVIYSGTLNGTNRQQFRLDQQTGIYFVRLEENNNVVTRKVVIK